MRVDKELTLRRQERIAEIKAILCRALQKGHVVYEKELVAQKCLKWGAARRTVKEYVNLLVDSGYCHRDENDLFIKRPLKGGVEK